MLKMSAKVASALDHEQPLIPSSGRFIWKEDNTGKGYLDWSSNNPNADKEKRRRAKEGKKGNDRVASSVARNNPAKNRGQRNPKSPKPIKQTDTHNTVTLDDVKSVAQDMLSEVEGYSDTFEGMYNTKQFDNFLMHLLSYFNCFFEKLHQEHKQNISTYIEPSLSEKQAYADSLVKLEEAQRYLGQAYCVLVLGLDLKPQHHMSCGQSRVSSTDKDRSMFETLYSFCTFVVWITFKRKDYEAVRKEVGRMLRSDTFNPAIRVKNAPEEKEPEKREEGGKREIQVEKKLTPAEYRRLHPKRPAIKSIIHQRSPAVVAILPSPKEEAHWLFKTRRPLSPNSLGKIGHEDDDDAQEADLEKTGLFSDKENFKIGIIGDSLSQYNDITLSPKGAENEDEENEGDDGEQKQEEDTDKSPQPEKGLSRQKTDVSETVTDAFPDD